VRSPTSLEVEVRPPWPYRLPRGGGGDGAMRIQRGIATRLLHVAGDPIVVRAWQRRDSSVVVRADPAADAATRGRLEVAVERMRFALGVDDDYTDFYAFVRGDQLVGRAVSRRPWIRPRRRPWPWEALAWAVTEQLIESSRAAVIQRRIVARWGPRHDWSPRPLRDVPAAARIAGRAPAELAGLDLAPKRALALVKAAREVASGRADLTSGESDRRLLAISNIGPWTVQCLGLRGRGDPDALPAGDLAFVKLVGRLARLGRRATVEEVEEFFAPYAPFRGLAGSFALNAYHSLVARPQVKLAARPRWASAA
jgi:3-methyladenine DNA glycosylase/8-oxoguanine DNA glycosylase